jgi:hypothetical protein
VAALLIEHGAQTDHKLLNATGPQSCLQFAIQSKNAELASLFIRQHWELYVQNPCSLIHLLTASENGVHPLQLASSKSSPEILGLLLTECSKKNTAQDILMVLSVDSHFSFLLFFFIFFFFLIPWVFFFGLV